MRRTFLTGLALLLPLTLTIIIVIFLFNLLTTPFLGIVQGAMDRLDILSDGIGFISSHQIKVLVSRILILIFLVLFTIGLGALTRWYILHSVIRFGEFILQRIPFVNSLYNTFKDVTHTIFTSKTSSFKQVVMLPFPHKESYTIGLVTREEIFVDERQKRVAVFVPTTPNPTSGYLLLVKPEDITYLDLQVEEALKYIISCGVVLVPLKKITAEEAQKLIIDTIEEGMEG